MRPNDTVLLDNLFQALDRLYDQQITVVDLHALLQATGAALPTSELAKDVEEATKALGVIVGAGMPEPEKNRAALVATQALRKKVGRELAHLAPRLRPR